MSREDARVPRFRCKPSAQSRVGHKHVCDEIAYYMRRGVATVTDMPCIMIVEHRYGVWKRVLQAREAHSYSRNVL